MDSERKIAVIIGAGPAGLTAAYELAKSGSAVKPLVFEQEGQVGGIAKTINYRGNRIDVGGHRFFSKSDRVMKWWQNILPLEGGGASSEDENKVLLVRKRLSRIYFLRKFFDYPVTLSWNTVSNLGLFRMVRIGAGYIRARFFPVKPERSLEEFFVNRFGRTLYETFFKDYTEKVWGVPCNQIKPEWGAQRVKGLSLTKTIAHTFKKILFRKTPLEQKGTETSLIEKFLYPKFGPGQMWEEAAAAIESAGGEVRLNWRAEKIIRDGSKITGVELKNLQTGEVLAQKADHVFSTMPIRDFIACLHPPAPPAVTKVAAGLVYRDFMTAGLLLKRLKIKNQTRIATENNLIPDNWIYIQEPDVRLGRLQIFNNWSPAMVSDKNLVWMGLEYFCNEGDDLWSKTDGEFVRFAGDELEKIGIIDTADVLDSVVIRQKKAYPAYFGTYDDLPIVKNFTDGFANLFLIGRNGMHRYNNQDHSMLSAMAAVENLLAGEKDKENIWGINAEKQYLESK